MQHARTESIATYKAKVKNRLGADRTLAPPERGGIAPTGFVERKALKVLSERG
jgi:hypothetical protein